MSTSLVVFPGHLCNARLYRPLIDALAPRYSIEVADLYGDDCVARLAAGALSRMPQKPILLAHSMGGAVAFELLRQAPDSLAGLILMATTARAEYAAQSDRRSRAVELVKQRDWQALAALYAPAFFYNDNLSSDPRLAECLAAMIAELDAEGIEKQQRAFANRIDSRPSLSAISCPTLVVCGRNDVITPLAHSQEMAAAIAGAQLAVIDQCGHSPALEQPAALRQIVSDWLQR